MLGITWRLMKKERKKEWMHACWMEERNRGKVGRNGRREAEGRREKNE